MQGNEIIINTCYTHILAISDNCNDLQRGLLQVTGDRYHINKGNNHLLALNLNRNRPTNAPHAEEPLIKEVT